MVVVGEWLEGRGFSNSEDHRQHDFGGEGGERRGG